MLPWIFLILCCSIRAEYPEGLYSVYISVPFTREYVYSGQFVALAGAVVSLSCNYYNSSWYRWDGITGQYHMEVVHNHLVFSKTTIEDSGEYVCANLSTRITTRQSGVNLTVVEKLSPLRVVATPVDLVIVEGRSRVTLHCNASSVPSSVTWAWHKMEHQGGWQEVGTERDLTLTKAEESGTYRCHALSWVGIRQEQLSSNHTVYIISLPTTAGEKLGVAAFVLCFLAWILLFAILLWLGRQRFNERASLSALANTNAPAKGLAGPAKTPKGGQPQSAGDGEVYMNYTSNNEAYSDLDPTYMAGEEVYSALS